MQDMIKKNVAQEESCVVLSGLRAKLVDQEPGAPNCSPRVANLCACTDVGHHIQPIQKPQTTCMS